MIMCKEREEAQNVCLHANLADQRDFACKSTMIDSPGPLPPVACIFHTVSSMWEAEQEDGNEASRASSKIGEHKTVYSSPTMSALMPVGNQTYFSFSSCSLLETGGAPLVRERDTKVVKGAEPGSHLERCCCRGQPQFTHFLLYRRRWREPGSRGTRERG